jgi:hypothetical protein
MTCGHSLSRMYTVSAVPKNIICADTPEFPTTSNPPSGTLPALGSRVRLETGDREVADRARSRCRRFRSSGGSEPDAASATGRARRAAGSMVGCVGDDQEK